MKDMCSVYPGAVNVSIVLIVTRIVLIILALDNSFWMPYWKKGSRQSNRYLAERHNLSRSTMHKYLMLIEKKYKGG